MSEDIFQDDVDSLLGAGTEEDLVSWVMGKCEDWRDHYESNYSQKHDEYMRLYRNQWSAEDSERNSERSKLIAPALSQAVESSVAEVEESTFGRGQVFDIRDDYGDQNPQEILFLRNKLHDAFAKTGIRTAVSEVLVNAAVYGTGIGELVLEDQKVYVPTTQAPDDNGISEYGVETKEEIVVKINPVQPKNFLIDPSARCVDDALGCAIDEYVSRHYVEELQEGGVYLETYVGNAASDMEIEQDMTAQSRPEDRIRLTKYYGRVPRDLLLASPSVREEDIVEDGHYVESIIVIGNEGTLLKAVPSPYMCQDRPVVAFQWDIVPGIFWGRGVCEKGYMSQKALDSELRARIDALALTTHPMLAVDAMSVPRGAKMEVRPGRIIRTNGAPQQTLMPFNFGNLNAVTFQQGAALQTMVSQATGAADGTMPQVQNDVTAAGQSMSQGSILKRQKRTLVNFQENFLIPFIEKAAHRYMQFSPEEFPVNDYRFVPFSSLGAMAREYEVSQLAQILQMVGPQSPAHTSILTAIIDHMNVANREELIATIEKASQPDPQQQQAAMQKQQQQEQAQLAILQGQYQLLQSQAAESQSRAQKYATEAQLAPTEMTLKYSDTDKDGQIDVDFQQRVQMAELLLKEQELQLRQDKEMEQTKAKAEAELVRQLTGGMNGAANNTGPSEAPSGSGL